MNRILICTICNRKIFLPDELKILSMVSENIAYCPFCRKYVKTKKMGIK